MLVDARKPLGRNVPAMKQSLGLYFAAAVSVVPALAFGINSATSIIVFSVLVFKGSVIQATVSDFGFAVGGGALCAANALPARDGATI